MKQNNASSALAPDRALDVRFMEFRSTRVASAPPRDCSSVIASAVQRGDLWNARRRALAHCLRPPETDVPALSFLTAARSAPPAPPSFDDDCGRQCARAWSSAIEELFAQPDHLRRIRRTHRRHFRRLGSLWAPRLTDCFAGGARAEGWEACCSTLRPLERAPRKSAGGGGCATHDPACCAMGNTSRAFLRLPALRELAVQVRLPTGQLLRIEQDGLLRPFDLPTVLWPAGYLLALWAASAASGCAPGAKVVEL